MRHFIGTFIVFTLIGAGVASGQDAVYQQQIAQAQAAIGALTVDQQAATAQIGKAQVNLAAVQRKAVAASNAINQFRAEATAGFLAGPAYRAATNGINAAQASQRSAVDSVTTQLQGDAQYMQLSGEVDQALAELNELRADDVPDQNALTAASAAWLDAKNAQSKRLNEAMNADASIAAADHRVATTIQARAALVNSFNHDLALAPQVAALNANVSGVKTELASATADLAAAQARKDSDAQQIAQLQSTITAAQEAAAAAIADANQGDGGGNDDSPPVISQPQQTIIITLPANSSSPGRHDHGGDDQHDGDHSDGHHHEGDHQDRDRSGDDHHGGDHHAPGAAASARSSSQPSTVSGQ